MAKILLAQINKKELLLFVIENLIKKEFFLLLYSVGFSCVMICHPRFYS